MSMAKEHVSNAVHFMVSGLRHLHHVQRVLAKTPWDITDEDFDTAMEHFEAVLDELNDTSLSLAEPLPLQSVCDRREYFYRKTVDGLGNKLIQIARDEPQLKPHIFKWIRRLEQTIQEFESNVRHA